MGTPVSASPHPVGCLESQQSCSAPQNEPGVAGAAAGKSLAGHVLSELSPVKLYSGWHINLMTWSYFLLIFNCVSSGFLETILKGKISSPKRC